MFHLVWYLDPFHFAFASPAPNAKTSIVNVVQGLTRNAWAGTCLPAEHRHSALPLSLSLFQNQCMSAGQTAFFQKLHTSGSGAKVSWVIMSHRNKMNKQQTTSYLQKVLSCTRSVESSVSNVGQADPRQAQGCIKGSLPTSRQIQHSRAWRGRRLNKNGGLLVSIRGSMMVLPTCLSVFVQQFYNFTSTSMRLEKQTIFLVAQLHSFRWTGQNIYKI